MRALDPEVANAVWKVVKVLLPKRRTTILWVVTIPASTTGSVFRDPCTAGNGLFMDHRRIPVGRSGVGYRTVGPTRRMDSRWGVRPSGNRSAVGL